MAFDKQSFIEIFGRKARGPKWSRELISEIVGKWAEGCREAQGVLVRLFGAAAVAMYYVEPETARVTAKGLFTFPLFCFFSLIVFMPLLLIAETLCEWIIRGILGLLRRKPRPQLPVPKRPRVTF